MSYASAEGRHRMRWRLCVIGGHRCGGPLKVRSRSQPVSKREQTRQRPPLGLVWQAERVVTHPTGATAASRPTSTKSSRRSEAPAGTRLDDLSAAATVTASRVARTERSSFQMAGRRAGPRPSVCSSWPTSDGSPPSTQMQAGAGARGRPRDHWLR